MASEKRIDGEQHFATWSEANFDSEDHFDCDGTFEVYRRADNKQVCKWFWGEAQGPEPDARSAVKSFDETARHFIAAERKRMIGDLQNAAHDCDGHTPYSILMALAEELRALEATTSGEGE